MQFVYPLFLWGLFAVAVPLIIHLFRLRRFQIVFFSNNKLLRQIQLETRKKSNLRHLIILLLRIFAIAALVIAFAQPFFPFSNQSDSSSAKKNVAIYIDNSFSMEVGDAYYSRLNGATSAAASVINGFQPADRFFILTNNTDASSFRPLSKQQANDKVANIQLAPFQSSFSDIISRFREIKLQHHIDQLIGFVISDFQKSFFKVEELHDSMSDPVYLIPIEGTPVSNIGIDSVWLDSPVMHEGHQLMVNVSVRNYSQEPREGIQIEMLVDGKRRSIASCDLAAGQNAVVQLSFVPSKSGTYSCLVKTNDSPVTYDDGMYFSFTVEKKIKVLVISGKDGLHKSLSALFKNDTEFEFKNVSSTSTAFGLLSDFSFVILDGIENIQPGFAGEINAYIQDGGSLAVIPPVNPDFESYEMFFNGNQLGSYDKVINTSMRVSKLNTNHSFFSGVFDGIPRETDMPTVKKYFSFKGTSSSWKLPLMIMQNDEPFLFMSGIGEGKMYVFSCPLHPDFSDFYKHALFVPVFYRMALLSNRQTDLYYYIGSMLPMEFSHQSESANNPYVITNPDQTIQIIPGLSSEGKNVKLFVHQQIDSAGNYMLMCNGDSLYGASFNYQRNESILDFYNKSELDSVANDAGLKTVETIESGDSLTADIQLLMQGRKLWKTFLFAALLFLAFELILLRFWK